MLAVTRCLLGLRAQYFFELLEEHAALAEWSARSMVSFIRDDKNVEWVEPNLLQCALGCESDNGDGGADTEDEPGGETPILLWCTGMPIQLTDCSAQDRKVIVRCSNAGSTAGCRSCSQDGCTVGQQIILA